MRRMMIAAALLIGATTAHAQDKPYAKQIYSGGKGGAYEKMCGPTLPAVLDKMLLPGYSCVGSAGSLYSIGQILKEPKNLALVQYDVYAREVAAKPDEMKKVTVAKELAACEALFFVTKNERINNYGDLLGLARRLPITVPEPGSGAEATLQYLFSQDPEGLGRARREKITHVKDGASVIQAVANGSDNGVGFLVQLIDPTNPNIIKIGETKLKAIPVLSREIVRSRAGDQAVYQVNDFEFKANYFGDGKPFRTACTPVKIITGSPDVFTDRNDKDDQTDMIREIAKLPDSALLPHDDKLLAFIKSVKKVSQQAIDQAIEATEGFRKKKEAEGG